MLDVFIPIVRFADGEAPRPWWHYTAERKRRLSGPC
nr:helix-hairpin-helix domain-containing protein [Jeongeupia sp. USM3]